MGDCQNYGPFLGLYYNTGPNTGPNLGDPKRDHNFDNLPFGTTIISMRVRWINLATIWAQQLDPKGHLTHERLCLLFPLPIATRNTDVLSTFCGGFKPEKPNVRRALVEALQAGDMTRLSPAVIEEALDAISTTFQDFKNM